MKRWISLGCALFLAGSTAWATGVDQEFDARVAPVLARHCLDCHSGADAKGRLDLSGRTAAFAGGEGGEAIVPGKPEESLLWEKVESGEMPPKSALADAEKSALKDWIAGGAHWGTDPIDPYQVTTARRAGRDWWSLRPIRETRPPAVAEEGRAQTPIDAFLLRSLEARGLKPVPEAGRRELIRRLTFDLIGLPPAPEEVDLFVRDRSEDAYERLVDRLLASPQYGVRWALVAGRRPVRREQRIRIRRIPPLRPGDIATGWSGHSTGTCPMTSSPDSRSPGTCCGPSDAGAVEATGFLVAGAYDTAGQNQAERAMRAVVRAGRAGRPDRHRRARPSSA